MSEPNLDNPAGLLRHWLNRMASIDNSQALSVVVCQLLEVDHESYEGRGEVMKFGASLVDLCQRTRREALLLPESFMPELLLADFEQVEKAVDHLTSARQQPVSNMLGSIDAAGRRTLEILDNYLHLNRPQKQIEEEKRERLTDLVRYLIDGITDDPDLPLDVKALALDRLHEVEKALRMALLDGAVGVERATEMMIGSLRNPVQRDLWARISKSKWGPRIGHTLAALCLALDFANNTLELIGRDSPIQIEYNLTVIQEDGNTPAPAPELEPPHPDGEIVDAELVHDDDEQTG